MILDVYVDDIRLTGSDVAGIMKAKEYLKTHFVTKDMVGQDTFLRLNYS